MAAGCLGEEGEDGDTAGDDDGSGADAGGDDGAGDDTGGGGETVELVQRSITEVTSSFAHAQGIATVINDNTDAIHIDNRPSQGPRENLGLLQRGEADIGLGNIDPLTDALEREDPSLEYEPYQLFFESTVEWTYMTNHDVEYIDEIEPPVTVFPGTAGGGMTGLMTAGLEHMYNEDDIEIVDTGVSEQGSAFAEGRIDIGIAHLNNTDFGAGWQDQNTATADLHIPNWSDDLIESINNDDDINLEVRALELDWGDGWTDFPDQTDCFQFYYNYITRDDMAYEPVKDYMDTLIENRDDLGEFTQLGEYYEDIEWFVEKPFDIPFHPAAADALEEAGVWSDEFERGEEA